MEGVNVSVVIPFLNEEGNLAPLVERFNNFCRIHPEIDLEVVFVDDGSADGSVAELQSCQLSSFRGKLVRLSRNFGSHAALRAGNSIATGSYIALTTADHQDPVGVIGDMLRKVNEGNEIVWGYRKVSHIPLWKRFGSYLYACLMRRFAVPEFPVQGTDLVMYSQRVKRYLDLQPESHSSVFLQILSLGFRQTFVEYRRGERLKGRSKWKFGAKIKLLTDSFIAFSYFPIRLVSVTGMVIFFAGIGWTTYIVARTLIYDDLMIGWPFMISVLMLGFGLTNIGLGIVAEYLWRTLDASRKRPVFIIDQVFDMDWSDSQGRTEKDV